MTDIVEELEQSDGRVHDLLIRAANEIRFLRQKLRSITHEENPDQHDGSTGTDRLFAESIERPTGGVTSDSES